MSGTSSVVVGDRGRIVIPQEVRERQNLVAGTKLILLETDGGLLLLTRKQLRDRVRADLGGADLVGELIVERREAARTENE